ncbi:hypothetical protein [Solimonas flava]|uniref:hypothetical protein n=1 Tax=Solimonas flava TaxID=415849 RepID=UPI0003FD16EB|nr:hypothetical protein [Solimonas flava]
MSKDDDRKAGKPKREQPQKTYGPPSRFGSGAYGSGGRAQKSAEHRAGKSRKVH